MTPEQRLRQIFGETDGEEPLPQAPPRNTTPLFRLASAMPEFARELRHLLIEQGEPALAASVPELWVFDRCRCGAEHCATIYTRPPKREGKFTGRGGLTVFFSNGDPIYIDTVDGMIACIEILDQPAFRSIVLDLLP